MNKKLFLAVMATTLAVPVAVAQVPADVEASKVANKVTVYANPFKDIPVSNPYYKMIHEMRDAKIINGYENHTFRPNVKISREHASALIARALKMNDIELEKKVTSIQPKDLSATSAYYADMMLLVEAGLLTTDSKGNINPKKELTRGEMARILAVAFNLQVKADYVFSDVKGSEYEEYVKALYSNGVTTGHQDGTFKLNDGLTRLHYVLFMHRAMNLDENFVAKPIPTPTTKPVEVKPTPTPTPSSTNPIKYTNVKDIKDIPRPAGYVAGEHEKKNQEIVEGIMKENQHRHRSGTKINGSWVTEEWLRNGAKAFETTYEEFVKVINWAIETGKVHDGKTYSIYFNYQQGMIETTN